VEVEVAEVAAVGVAEVEVEAAEVEVEAAEVEVVGHRQDRSGT